MDALQFAELRDIALVSVMLVMFGLGFIGGVVR